MNTIKAYRIFSALVCLILMLALTIGNVSASPTLQTETDFAAIDAYISEQMNNLGIPGMALGIIQDGQVKHLQGFGAADSAGRAVTPQTPFYLGSVTKSFTALAVMQLVEAGKIDLDAPVQKYLPWFTLEDKDASARITVRHLLNQTSGMSTRDGNRFWPYQQTLEEAVRGLDDIVLVHPIGTTFEYCNFNYIIAGLIVEVVSGQSYAAYVSENIFEPLDMHHSYASLEPALADGLSDGHIIMFGHVYRDMRVRSPAALPTGFLMSSVEDMTHFAMAQLNEGQYEETTILSPQGIAQMHASAVSQGNGGYWGIGWDVSEYDGMKAVARVGDTGHFHAIMILLPEKEMAVILLANASSFEYLSARVVDATGIGVFEILNGKPAAPVSVPFLIQFLYWLLLLTPLLQIVVNIFIWRRRQRIKILGVLLTVVLNLVVAFTILNLAQQQMPIRSLLVYNPELGCASILAVVTGFGWSAIYTIILLMKRQSLS